VPKVIELAEQALKQDKCIVIGLQVRQARWLIASVG
jgi:hypothetical protein